MSLWRRCSWTERRSPFANSTVTPHRGVPEGVWVKPLEPRLRPDGADELVDPPLGHPALPGPATLTQIPGHEHRCICVNPRPVGRQIRRNDLAGPVWQGHRLLVAALAADPAQTKGRIKVADVERRHLGTARPAPSLQRDDCLGPKIEAV